MQIGYSNDKGKGKLEKKLFGCPACHVSRYVVVTSTIKDKRYQYRELYCHYCNISFSPAHAVTPIELKE
jgi:hypothetical protein